MGKECSNKINIRLGIDSISYKDKKIYLYNRKKINCSSIYNKNKIKYKHKGYFKTKNDVKKILNPEEKWMLTLENYGNYVLKYRSKKFNKSKHIIPNSNKYDYLCWHKMSKNKKINLVTAKTKYYSKYLINKIKYPKIDTANNINISFLPVFKQNKKINIGVLNIGKKDFFMLKKNNNEINFSLFLEIIIIKIKDYNNYFGGLLVPNFDILEEIFENIKKLNIKTTDSLQGTKLETLYPILHKTNGIDIIAK